MFENLSPQQRNIANILLVLVFLALAAYFLISVGILNTDSGSRFIELRVDTDGGYAMVTLQAGNISINEPMTVTTPWTKKMRLQSGTQVYLTAMDPTHAGELSCEIKLDRVVWKTDVNNAPKDGVACAGIVP
jgi:hypothetical protein